MSSRVEQYQLGHWHPSVNLYDFVDQVSCLVEIVDMTMTPKLVRFDAETIKRAMGWGSYIEEVINSLDTDWQREMLMETLAHEAKGEKRIATLSRLRQARRLVLSSLLSSAFLVDHPKPRALLKWAMAEYLGLPSHYASTSGEGSAAKEAEHKDSRFLNAFVVDATDVMITSAYTAVLSHAYSSLMACAQVRTTDGCSSRAASDSAGPHSTCNGDRIGSPVSARRCPTCSTEAMHAGKGPRPPSNYETSVETAQKRAYASSCFRVCVAKWIREEGGSSRAPESDEFPGFIADITTLARTDTIAMEVMCFMLLEPCRTTTHTEGSSWHEWVHGANSPTPDFKPPGRHSSPIRMLLDQVLAIRDDGRLWSLDAWLLSEVSHNYLPFADAYLAHLLAGLLQLRQKEIDTGCREQPTSSLAFRRKNLSERLAILSSRSSRLGTLCRAALAWSNFDHSVGDT